MFNFEPDRIKAIRLFIFLNINQTTPKQSQTASSLAAAALALILIQKPMHHQSRRTTDKAHCEYNP